MVPVLAFATVVGSILVKDIGGGVFWQLGFFSLGGVVTLHFAVQIPKVFKSDE